MENLENNQPEPTSEAKRLFDRTMGEAKTLRTTERILGQVECVILSRVSEDFDVKPALEAAEELKKLSHNASDEDVLSLEARLNSQFALWREALKQRDEQIAARDLRRLCEHSEELVEPKDCVALTCFYLSLPFSEVVLQKYDFIITRLFATKTEAEYRKANVTGAVLVNRLKEMRGLCSQSNGSAAYATDEAQTVADRFKVFLADVGKIHSFNDLIAANLFNRIRIGKLEMGAMFFTPEVTAAAIECNVIVANKFAALLEMEDLHTAASETSRQLAAAFSDTHSDTDEQLEKLLREIKTDFSEQTATEKEHLEKLLDLLQLSFDAEEAADAGALPIEWEADLQEFEGAAENSEIISQIRRTPWSVESHSINFRNFLGKSSESNESIDEMRREALQLIIRAENSAANVAESESADEADIKDLLGEMQNIGKRLQYAVVSNNERKNLSELLMHISNQVLSVRLRVQTALVQQGINELARQEAENQTAKIIINIDGKKPVGVQPRISIAKTVYLRRVGQIAGGAALIFAALFFFRFHADSQPSNINRDPEARKVESKDLPDSILYVAVNIRRDQLIGTVSKTWAALSDDAKHEALRKLSEYGKTQGVSVIVLMDKTGAPVGSFSEDKLTIEHNT